MESESSLSGKKKKKHSEKSVGSTSEVQRDSPAVVQIHSVGLQICGFKLLPILTLPLLYFGSHRAMTKRPGWGSRVT